MNVRLSIRLRLTHEEARRAIEGIWIGIRGLVGTLAFRGPLTAFLRGPVNTSHGAHGSYGQF